MKHLNVVRISEDNQNILIFKMDFKHLVHLPFVTLDSFNRIKQSFVYPKTTLYMLISVSVNVILFQACAYETKVHHKYMS
jgi:hypothetical protein